jgi:nuclear pore complex protein Nup98-Nup96
MFTSSWSNPQQNQQQQQQQQTGAFGQPSTFGSTNNGK